MYKLFVSDNHGNCLDWEIEVGSFEEARKEYYKLLEEYPQNSLGCSLEDSDGNWVPYEEWLITYKLGEYTQNTK